jgi:hypothetical protein
LKFELTDEQIQKVEEFHPECKKIYTGAIGGGEEYTFMPTGLGVVVTYKCKCGEILELTDWESW